MLSSYPSNAEMLMKMITDLGKLHPDLEGILWIEGIGLTSNVYLILGKKLTMIDTGSGPPNNPVIPQLEQKNIDIQKIDKIVITHGHSDHIGGLIEFRSYDDIKIRAHPQTLELTPPNIKSVPLKNNETFQAGHLTLKTIYSPGHSAESICLYNPARQILFSGDTVFPYGGFGRTDLPTGDGNKLENSLTKLTNLSVKHMLAGHERPVIGNALSHIQTSLRSAQSLFSDYI